jgi:hypothetical protein
LGTSKDIIYPSTIDENPNSVIVTQDYKKIPYSSEIIANSKYRFAPPLNAFGNLASY